MKKSWMLLQKENLAEIVYKSSIALNLDIKEFNSNWKYIKAWAL